MVSPYVETESAAVRNNRRMVENALDKAWLAINQHGGRSTQSYWTGFNAAIDQALAEIEALGGMDPGLRRQQREAAE